MADPILVTPGQVVASGDWDALVRQHGGTQGPPQMRQPTTDEKSAATKAAAAAAPLGEGEEPDPNDPRTWYIRHETNPIWRQYLADGSYVEYRKADNGTDSAIVEYKPSQKFTQDPANKPSTADTPASKRTAREEAEIAANAALPADQDPRSETNAERAARADARIRQQGTDARNADAKARQDRLDQEASSRATSAEARAAAAANKADNKTETIDINGQRYTRVTTVSADGKSTSIKNYGPDGKEIAELPADTSKSGTPAEPEGAPRPSGRLGEAAADLEAYDRFLDQELRRPGTKLTPAQADKLRLARRDFWKTALEESQGIVNAQSQAYRDQGTQRSATLTDLANRRTNATQIATMSPWNPDPKTLGAGGADGLASALRNSRVDAANFVTLSGANRMVPEVQQGPALASVVGMPLPGGAMAPGFNPRPNAIGLGAIGGQPAPGGGAIAPVTAGVTATNAAAINPTGQNIDAANQATQAGFHSAVAPLLPPSQPVGGAPQAMLQPSPTFLAADSRGHAHDPTAEIRRMIADPRMDNAVIRQVVAEDYPGYPIDQLLGAA